MSIVAKTRLIFVGRIILYALSAIALMIIVQSFIEIKRLGQQNKTISQQNQQLSKQTLTLAEQNKVLADENRVLANQNKGYVRCVANVFATYTQDYQAVTIKDIDTCTVIKEGQQVPVEVTDPSEASDTRDGTNNAPSNQTAPVPSTPAPNNQPSMTEEEPDPLPELPPAPEPTLLDRVIEITKRLPIIGRFLR